MTIQIFDCDQNSSEWKKTRCCGIPTASMFHAVLAKGEGKTRKAYLYRVASEIITDDPIETFTSQAMERGKEMEDEARSYYSFAHNVELARVGFIRNGQKGCSPDSLIGKDGILEIKTQRGDLLIETLIKDQFPSEHKAQCQGELWITEREWIDIAIYWPKMPMFVKRAFRDEVYIAELSREVDRFNQELAETVEKIRRIGRMEAA